MKKILKTIVTIARIIYIPYIYDYELCHVSRHLPKDVVENLEVLYKVNSFDDIEKNISLSLDILKKFEEEYRNSLQ